MLDEFVEIIEEAPILVLGIIGTILLFTIGGGMGYDFIINTYYPKPVAPQIVYVNVTVTPSPVPTVKPVVTAAPEPAGYEYLEDIDVIPGQKFERNLNGAAGVYYGTFLNERCVYIDIEAWAAGGGKYIVANDLIGYTIYTRFGQSVSTRYDKSSNKIYCLSPDPYRLYLEREPRR